ncbi:hypothetical protein GX50_01644 [[Emmonsia] crescens]|uniref:Uncharacterized protein n=1 Tax=[Emmonsia] crescens TaxID=73230 RepID=A0A2B7ZRB6_9EURO|nr:hypothetical protein GX50_01644 [Emmonsia crescens]
MAPKFKNHSTWKSKQGQKAAQGEDVSGSKHKMTAELLQPRTYSPKNLGNSGPAPPPATPPAAITSCSILETAEDPQIYYPKEKKASDKSPDSAPLLPRGYSFSKVTEQPPRVMRKVSSTPRLRGDEFMFSGNRATAQTSSNPASSVGSAETPQEDYCLPLPKLEGIILGSPDLSLTRKGTCGTRGSGKLIVPERKISSSQGSVIIEDVEEYVCGSSSTVTPRRTPSENNTEVSLPRQNLTPSSQLMDASSHNSSFSRGRSKSRARGGVRNSSRNSAIYNIAHAQGLPFLVQPPIYSHHDHYMAPEISPGQDSNVVEQPEPAIDSAGMVPQVLSIEGTPQNEILLQLKTLSENVTGIKIEQMKIKKQLEDTNTQLKAFSEELQLENDATCRSLAAYEKNINNHITQVVGTLGEVMESVAIAVAKISDKTANISSENPKTSEGDDLKWSDDVEQEAHETSVRTPMTTYRAPFDQGDVRPSNAHSTDGRRGSDVNQEDVGSPIGRARSQTNPSVTGDTSQEQGQQQLGGWRGPPTTQKRGFWNHKRHNGGISRRGSATCSANRKAATPDSTGQHPPMPVAPQAQGVTSPNSYAHSHTHGAYEDQSYIHPAARTPGPSTTYAPGSVQHRGFPPRQSSMRHNHTFMRGRAGPSNRNYMPHRDFSPNYGSPPQQSGPGQSQPGHPHFQANQNVGNTPSVGQWPVDNPEFNAYRPWTGVSNWYHQVNPQGNNNMQSPPN